MPDDSAELRENRRPRAGSRRPQSSWRWRGIRNRSALCLAGLPLYDIAVGPNPENDEFFGHVRGLIAIGDVATGIVAIGGRLAVGVFALGGVAEEVIGLGGCSIGLLVALGGVAIGAFALGGVAVGVVAFGGVAIGILRWRRRRLRQAHHRQLATQCHLIDLVAKWLPEVDQVGHGLAAVELGSRRSAHLQGDGRDCSHRFLYEADAISGLRGRVRSPFVQAVAPAPRQPLEAAAAS